MARSLPLYLNTSPTNVTASSAAPVATSPLGYGQAGVIIAGASAGLASAGGLVTLTIRDGDDLATSPVIYQVQFDFTSTQGTADFQSAPIPCIGVPSYTIQADATANGKGFTFGVYLQKIAIEG